MRRLQPLICTRALAFPVVAHGENIRQYIQWITDGCLGDARAVTLSSEATKFETASTRMIYVDSGCPFEDDSCHDG